MNKKINRIKCLKCNTILESKSVHDFQFCECENFTDGGLDYQRVGGNFEDILIWDWKNEKWEKLLSFEKGNE